MSRMYQTSSLSRWRNVFCGQLVQFWADFIFSNKKRELEKQFCSKKFLLNPPPNLFTLSYFFCLGGGEFVGFFFISECFIPKSDFQMLGKETFSPWKTNQPTNPSLLVASSTFNATKHSGFLSSSVPLRTSGHLSRDRNVEYWLGNAASSSNLRFADKGRLLVDRGECGVNGWDGRMGECESGSVRLGFLGERPRTPSSRLWPGHLFYQVRRITMNFVWDLIPRKLKVLCMG